MTPRDLVTLRTPVKEQDPAADDGKKRKRAPDQVFHCRLAYALYSRRAIEGADESAGRIRPLYLALICDEGSRRPIDAAIATHGYLEATSDRVSPRRVEFLKRTGYRRSYQHTAAGPSIHTLWAPGYFEVEPPANAAGEAEDDADAALGPLVRLCSMPPLADLRTAQAEDPRRWSEALAWAADLGLEGPRAEDPRYATLGPAAAWWCAQLDRRVAAPMLHDARFQVQVLLAAARSSAVNGMYRPRAASSAACALWAAGDYGTYGDAQSWGRGDRNCRGDGEHFQEYGLPARAFGLADPILTIARDGALRYLLARECRAFEAAARAPAAQRGAAYADACALAEQARLSELEALQAATKEAKARAKRK